MKNALALLAGLLSSVATACGDVPPGAAAFSPSPLPSTRARLPARRHTHLHPTPVLAPVAHAPRVLTWTDAHDLAVIDPRSGAIEPLVTTDHRTGEPDLIYNPWTERAVVFELDEAAETGEIASYPVTRDENGTILGERAH